MLNLSKLEVTDDSIDMDYQKKNVRVKAKKHPQFSKKENTLESSIPALSNNDSKILTDSRNEQESDDARSDFDEERAEILKELKDKV